VQQAVMTAAQIHKVGQGRLAAVGPMADVMGVDPAPRAATGEAAAAVARGQRPAQGRRDRARLSPDSERRAGAFQQRHDRGVAGQPAGRLGREGCARVELAALAPSARTRLQRGSVDVHDDLVAITAGAIDHAAREEAVGQEQQRVGAGLTCGGRWRFRGNARAPVVAVLAEVRRRFRGSARTPVVAVLREVRRRFRGSARTPVVAVLGEGRPRFLRSARPPVRAARGLIRARLRRRGLQRRDEQRALLAGQSRAQQQPAVVVVAPGQPALPANPTGRRMLDCDHTAIGAHQPLELRRRRVPRQVEQLRLAHDPLNARQRADLRVAQPALGERLPDQRQVLQAKRHAHVRARRHQRDPAAPRHPVRARPTAPRRPPLTPVVLGHQSQPATRRGVDLARQPGDLALEHTERSCPVMVVMGNACSYARAWSGRQHRRGMRLP
jgi:hypothetical protein